MKATTSVGNSHVVDLSDAAAFYRHGWHSWSPTGWVEASARRVPIADERRRLGHDDPAHAFDVHMGGSGVGALEHADGSVTVLGALAPGAWVWPDGTSLHGESEAGPLEWFVATGGEGDVFRAYAEALGDRLGRRGGAGMRVWCSWYSFYENITETALDEVLTGLGRLAFDVVQIDDGWQQGIGDWRPNRGFPHGMAQLANQIQAGGRRAGLWLAPLIAGSSSRLAAEQPELLLRSADGSPVVAGVNWGEPYFALDPAADATHDFLRRLIATVRNWGYDYLKLDFLYAGAFPGVHQHGMPRELAYRSAIEVIRNAAGDDCYLLGCGAPVIASVGVFDGLRIGPDVAEFWEDQALSALGDESARGARNAMLTSSQRLWLGAVIDSDPDVVYFRSRDIDLPDRAKLALQDLARIAGFVGVSDPPSWLSPGERTALDRYLREPRATVVREGRHRWRVDDRLVDLSWALDPQLSSLPPAGRR